MKKQFTATVYILDQGQVLLIYHKKLGKWLPPGGHLELNELPHEGAIREAKEETGLDVELILQENLWVDRWNAKSIPRPYFCMIEEIAARADEPAHQHIDLLYIAKPLHKELVHNHAETSGLRWFNAAEIAVLKGDEEIFIETQETIRHLLAEFSPTKL
ncbi:MAG: NUDIX domain-containing protein [Parachlamydiales bacterium]|jgi:ADP-ribose pyrophosphatase YjhB (NUDIX family)